jgi:hypothetical protein
MKHRFTTISTIGCAQSQDKGSAHRNLSEGNGIVASVSGRVFPDKSLANQIGVRESMFLMISAAITQWASEDRNRQRLEDG